jgi:hypothetical protein
VGIVIAALGLLAAFGAIVPRGAARLLRSSRAWEYVRLTGRSSRLARSRLVRIGETGAKLRTLLGVAEAVFDDGVVVVSKLRA